MHLYLYVLAVVKIIGVWIEMKNGFSVGLYNYRYLRIFECNSAQVKACSIIFEIHSNMHVGHAAQFNLRHAGKSCSSHITCYSTSMFGIELILKD